LSECIYIYITRITPFFHWSVNFLKDTNTNLHLNSNTFYINRNGSVFCIGELNTNIGLKIARIKKWLLFKKKIRTINSSWCMSPNWCRDSFFFITLWEISTVKFEDTKEIIRSRTSKMDRKNNGQKKKKGQKENQRSTKHYAEN